MNKKKLKFTFDWVLINELAIGPAPREKENISLLKNKGIKGVLSLCSEDEVMLPIELKDHFVCNRFFLPDHKYNDLPTIEDIKKSIAILNKMMKNGPIFIHCVAAIERSPLICMAWLMVQKKLTYIQAYNYMVDVHETTNPLPEQLELLNNLS